MTTVTNNSPQAINTSLFALEQEIKKLYKDLDSISERLVGIEGSDTVVSVNGKKGVVQLKASDVGALPSDTKVPTTTGELVNNSGFVTLTELDKDFVRNTRTINGKPLSSNVVLSASDVGALPSNTVIPPEQVNSDWNATSGKAEILNKPDLSIYTEKGDVYDFSTSEKLVGTWLDGESLYEKTIVLNVPKNGPYSTSIPSNEKVKDWRGNFFQGNVNNPSWVMHAPYTYIEGNGSTWIMIYIYFGNGYVNYSLLGGGQYASSYFNGQLVLTYKYTKA
ncbi:MAG: hypothetical protein MJZ50_01705 [Treponema sp.]|nr:hypothetical protein [Treponema sp.]